MSAATADNGPVLALHFRKGDVSLQDITLQELRIECFFPMDAPTAAHLRRWVEP